MTPSEAGLRKFLTEHPNLNPDEVQCLMYRAGYADGALDMLDTFAKAVTTKAQTVTKDV